MSRCSRVCLRIAQIFFTFEKEESGGKDMVANSCFVGKGVVSLASMNLQPCAAANFLA